jgi:P4 family phage/plasmid primase-like protien
MTALESRLRLLGLGLEPIPVRPKSKIPAIPKWQEMDITPQAIATWPEGNTGIRLSGIAMLDVDSEWPGIGPGELWVRRGRDNSNKVAFFVRISPGCEIEPLRSKVWIDAKGATHMVELRTGRGMQAVLEGEHPSGGFYHSKGELATANPIAIHAVFQSFCTKLDALAKALGWTLKEGQPGKDKFASADVLEPTTQLRLESGETVTVGDLLENLPIGEQVRCDPIGVRPTADAKASYARRTTEGITMTDFSHGKVWRMKDKPKTPLSDKYIAQGFADAKRGCIAYRPSGWFVLDSRNVWVPKRSIKLEILEWLEPYALKFKAKVKDVLLSEPKARNLEALAKLHLETDDPFDGAPDLISVPSGMLDLRTGALRARVAEDRCSRVLPFDPRFPAQCTKWETFLWEVTCFDGEMVSYLQRAVGYSLTGHTRENKLFWLTGVGANGKSVFLNILRLLFGSYGTTVAEKLLIGSRAESTDLARLPGMRVAILPETSSDSKWNELTIKSLASGDRMESRKLYHDSEAFDPVCKLWIASNRAPSFSDSPEAIARRLAILPFDASFRGRENRNLIHDLANELPGIMAWAIEGARLYYSHGLGVLERGEEAAEDYVSEMDPLTAWVNEKVEIGPGLQTPWSEIKKSVRQYMIEKGIPAKNINADVSSVLRSRGARRTRPSRTASPVWTVRLRG